MIRKPANSSPESFMAFATVLAVFVQCQYFRLRLVTTLFRNLMRTRAIQEAWRPFRIALEIPRAPEPKRSAHEEHHADEKEGGIHVEFIADDPDHQGRGDISERMNNQNVQRKSCRANSGVGDVGQGRVARPGIEEQTETS